MDKDLTSFIIRYLLLVMLTSLSYTSTLHAESRNCNKEEKHAANLQLTEIANDTQRQTTLIEKHLPHGLHTSNEISDNEQVFHQAGYILNHDSDLRTGLWVSYQLTETDLNNAAGKERVNCFRRDPRMIVSQTATPSDYEEPIYDQGHMTNDADLKHDLIQQINTYLMSNMSPQHCRFNRGIWLSLEHLSREWAKQYKNIYITSGAIFDRDGDAKRDADDKANRMKSNNGKERVAVPSHYYKVILRKENGTWKAITFLLENTNDKLGTKWDEVLPKVIYSITNIGVIEMIAGVTLHPNLNRSKLSQQLSDWDFSINQANFEGSCPD